MKLEVYRSWKRLFVDDAPPFSTARIYLSIDKRLPWGMLVSPVKLFIKAFQCAKSTLRHIELTHRPHRSARRVLFDGLGFCSGVVATSICQGNSKVKMSG